MSTVTITKQQVLTTLLRARDYVAQGWIQDKMYATDESTGHVCYCAEGALMRAVTDVHQDQGVPFFALQQLAYHRLERQVNGHTIWRWNDHPDRTQEQVVAAFDRAIDQVAGAPE